MKKDFRAIGLMSGSSLDGLDVALCRFSHTEDNGHYAIERWELLQAKTYAFSDFWKDRLRSLPAGSGFELMDAHAAFGAYMGQLVNRFFSDYNIDPRSIDLIASHGHTIFHEPAQGFTTQIGDGAALAKATRCLVVNDFRSADLALGGQGAPLAPMADKMLFPGYDFYLNLGGIANITCQTNAQFIAFDICGANQILNALANEAGRPYDDRGQIAARGKTDPTLFELQRKLDFFHSPYPKSLSNQWVQDNQTSAFLKKNNTLENRLHTAVQLISELTADAISNILHKEDLKKDTYQLLATGGGAYNSYLMESISLHTNKLGVKMVIPEEDIIGFKEAVLMALLGVMRIDEVPNCMASVTGAEKDAIGGAIYHP